jgi:L-fucose isomerase-like protein
MAARRFASKQKRCQGQFLGGYLSKHIAPGTIVLTRVAIDQCMAASLPSM